MTGKKVFLITGAGRGMGADIVRSALAAGHAVVATGRNPQRVSEALGAHEDLLVVALDVTDPASARTAVEAAVERFGRIDVLVNNAGNFYAGFFEEITPQDFRAQVETTLFGTLNVTRAVLPVMRAQRAGLVVMISSTAGITGLEFCSAYAAAKFGLEGWIESLAPEVEPFGIRTMLVEPGFFRTELLTPESTSYAQPAIDDYAERTKQTVAAWSSMDGQQGGDPAKLAERPHPAGRQQRTAAALGRGRRRRRRPSSRRPGPCSTRPMPTASCRPPSPTRTPERLAIHSGRERSQRTSLRGLDVPQRASARDRANMIQVRCGRVRDQAAGLSAPAVRGPLAGGGPQPVKIVHHQEARRRLPGRAGPRRQDGPGLRSDRPGVRSLSSLPRLAGGLSLMCGPVGLRSPGGGVA